ncbi:WD40 repeat-like protein [Laetiporus sulphureus 93-53]|uniref:WD40 repeat-like protein n=1 Tax=Laetiporus sulphureus 93-53 TaxID=1314785 RepID=A0A165AQR6_9APHY|nr:WD40 repeat-like protein [Laetiporus sulphureus 93-53]KZS99471.1 WD40 repeat-like protein [Laetiporus sulphureus 93-53]
MPLRYTPKLTLHHQHVDAITAVVFSADGQFLASGGQDGAMVIWSTTSGQAIYHITVKSGILCLLWPKCSNSIIAGTSDGTLAMFTITDNMITASGFVAHTGPIDALSTTCNMAVRARSASLEGFHSDPDQKSATPANDSCNKHLLASASGINVNIWRWDQETKFWCKYCGLEQPQHDPFSDGQPAEATGVQWLSPPDDNQLVVSYLQHGILCWKVGEHEDDIHVNWSIHMPFSSYSGCIAISPDNNRLAVCNIQTGFDVYEIPSGLHQLHIDRSHDKPDRILPIVFHHGNLILTGGMNGRLRLYNSAEGRCLQKLRLKTKAPIQAISAFYFTDNDTYLIAAGTCVEDSPNFIQIWDTVMVDSD